jgi:putative transposase
MPIVRRPVLGKGELHLIACSSYRHLPKLGLEKHRELFCQLLEQLRAKYRFKIVGYVVMPSGFEVLMSEPEMDSAETVIMALRQRYQRRYNTSARSDEPAWDKVISDKHVMGADRIARSLSIMHEAPVKAGLADRATDWEWSSARSFAGLPEGVVTVEPISGPRFRGSLDATGA